MKMIDQSLEIWDQNEMSYSKHLERCGRVCYQSDHLMNDGSDEGFVKRIMNNGHTSVIEHYWTGFDIDVFENEELIDNVKEFPYLFIIYRNKVRVSVIGNLRAWLHFLQKFPFNYRLRRTLSGLYPLIFKGESKLLPYSIVTMTGNCKPITVRVITSVAIGRELLRHRPLSPSQENTRFVNYSKGRFDAGLHFIKSEDWHQISDTERQSIEDLYGKTEALYNASERQPQNKRDMLPLQLKTEITMTGTLEMWQDVYRQRIAPAAHPQIRELMELINERVKIQG